MARTRLTDVAKLAGVHPATASRALNDTEHGRISADTVARVRLAAAELDYRPNQMARGLATNRSLTVGVIIGDLSVPLFPPVLLGIDDVTSDAGYTALIVNTDNDEGREEARMSTLRDRQVDGLIVATARTGDPAEAERFRSIAPTVFVVRTPTDPAAPSVLSDDSVGIHAVVAHLVSLGHTQIGHVAGPPGISTSITRLRAYREAMYEAGLTVDPRLIVAVDHLDADSGEAAFGRLLDSGAHVTAVVAFNDLVALGGYRAIRDRGIRCPDDVSIVGYNDMTGSDLVSPPLTTVRVDHYAMGREAARMLIAMLTHPDDHNAHSVRLPVELVLRESTAERRSERAHQVGGTTRTGALEPAG